MQDKTEHTERNIEKLIYSSFNNECHLDKQVKDDAMQMLLQRITRLKKVSRPEITIIVGLSMIWMTIIPLFFTRLSIPILTMDLIKSALGLSLVLIPVSSLILIILKWRIYERKID
jgi:hypothetical protein